jgi:hypothetical protein
MANDEHVALLKQGVTAWNESRLKNPDTRPNLRAADLAGLHLNRANLSGADLGGARLNRADLSGADLSGAHLNRTFLTGADLSAASLYTADLSAAELSAAGLSGVNLNGANLSGANLSGANLSGANLSGADVSAANLTGADLFWTVFGGNDLTSVIGLETCNHHGPSIIDHQTLERSKSLPLSFLRGVGLPDRLIEYLPSLLNQAIQHYSCFISYSFKDQQFAERLHADLQNKGVRCWFAPHDLLIGDKTWDTIDKAIKLRDKLLLILSKNSIDSDWVEDEVQKAFAEERDRKQLVLFPVRIDDAVMGTAEPWARKLRDQRNIGDFQRWKDHDAYKKSLERVVRGLTKLGE